MYKLIVKDLRDSSEFIIVTSNDGVALQRRADSLNKSNNTPHYHAYVAKR